MSDRSRYVSPPVPVVVNDDDGDDDDLASSLPQQLHAPPLVCAGPIIQLSTRTARFIICVLFFGCVENCFAHSLALTDSFHGYFRLDFSLILPAPSPSSLLRALFLRKGVNTLLRRHFEATFYKLTKFISVIFGAVQFSLLHKLDSSWSSWSHFHTSGTFSVFLPLESKWEK